MSHVTDLQDERYKAYTEALSKEAEGARRATLQQIEKRIGVINYGKIESLILGLLKCAELQGELRYKQIVIEQSEMRYKKDFQIQGETIENKIVTMNNEEANKAIMSKWESGEITHKKAVALYNERNGTELTKQEFVVEARNNNYSKTLYTMRKKGEIL